MTDERARLERRIERLRQRLTEAATPSERQAARLGIRPAKPDEGDDGASKRAADRLRGGGR